MSDPSQNSPQNTSPAAAKKKNWKATFFPIWIGQIVSLVGSALVQFALVWWLTEETGSVAILTTATLVALLPDVLLGPFAGALVDRWNRRLVMIFADAFIALATIGMVVLFWLQIARPWHVFIILLVRSLGGAFHYPAMASSTSLIVPEKHLARVAGANQALRGAINIVAPPLGALLYSILPLYLVMSVDVITAGLAILPLLFVRIPQPVLKDQKILTPVQLLKEVGEGFRFLRTWKGAIELLLMAMLINFVLAPASTILPLLVKDHFSGGAWHLSLLESVLGVGIIVGGVALSAWGGFKRRIYTILMGILGIGTGILLTASAPADWFWLAVVAHALLGVMSPIANGPIMALMQARVPVNMQGRVFGSISSLATGMMPLSMLIATPVGEWLGVRAWYFIGGTVTILMATAGFFMPRLTHIEDQELAVNDLVTVEA